MRPEFADTVDRSAWLFAQHANNGYTDTLMRHQYVDQKTYLPDDILVKVDRMSMWHALEVRVPFLDHNVVEYANSIRPSLKLQGSTGKYILKQMMGSVLPQELLYRTKMGFGAPIKHWLRGRLRSFARDMLLSPESRCLAYLRREAVADLLDAHQERGQDMTARIWALLVLEEWCRAFGM
jgi:asparagine synthase (glutamine-hydrolysing)